jgi:hypothetical protein
VSVADEDVDPPSDEVVVELRFVESGGAYFGGGGGMRRTRAAGKRELIGSNDGKCCVWLLRPSLERARLGLDDDPAIN